MPEAPVYVWQCCVSVLLLFNALQYLLLVEIPLAVSSEAIGVAPVNSVQLAVGVLMAIIGFRAKP